MKAWKTILTIILSVALTCGGAFGAPDCRDAEYAYNHPEKCTQRSFATTAAPVLGGGAILGGALALIGMGTSGGGDNSAPAPTYVQPTMQTYNMVGNDIDATRLAGIVNSAAYTKNAAAYDDIRVGYSLARGYTGKTSTIAVLDAATWHGAAVMEFAGGTIAPDANIEFYQIADKYENFVSYNEIGDAIASAQNANIFNASWSVSMRAADVYSRDQITQLTGENFINQLSNAATRDAIFVFAAGNDYDHTDSNALSALPMVIPELNGHFINVVAWDSATGALADYSNACGTTRDWCITTPGTDLNTTTRPYAISGTSFAAPIVSAAISVIREAFPYMKSEQITSLLFETARDLGAPGVDEIYGHGMLDLERATRPVGAALVPLADNTTTALRNAHVSGAIANNIKSAGLKFAYLDSYGRAFDADLADNISIRNPGRGFARLRASTDNRTIRSGNIEFGIRPSDLTLGDGFMQTGQNDTVTFFGTHQEFGLGTTKIFGTTHIGTSRPHTTPNSIVTSFSSIITADATIGIESGNWRASVGIPDTIISGDMNLRLPVGKNATGQIMYQNASIDLAATPSVEYNVSYKSVTMGFIDNPYGTDEFFILTRNSIRF